jgi:hypothetical protein
MAPLMGRFPQQIATYLAGMVFRCVNQGQSPDPKQFAA